MSVWELRQAIESAIPVWLDGLLVIAVVVIMAVVLWRRDR